MSYKIRILWAALFLVVLPVKAYINPAGNRFPILAWYSIRPDSAITHERYLEMADCGFNVSFSHFGTRAEVAKALEACKGTGVMQMITCSDMESKTAEIVNQFKDQEMVGGWFLRDEPTCAGFPSLKAYKERVLQVDTKHCIYLNLNPNYAPLDALGVKTYREYVQRFVNEVNIGLISFDYYPIVEDHGKTYVRGSFYQNLEDAMAVSKTSNQPMWAFALSTAHDPYPVATREMLRLEVFSDLAYGAQCIQYFTYWNPRGTIWNFNTAPISMDGARTHVWYLVRDLNREIQTLAPIFLGANVISVTHTGKTIPEGTTKTEALPAPFKNLNPEAGEFIVSHLQNSDKHYLMIVNRDLHNPQTVQMEKTGKVKRIFAGNCTLTLKKNPDKINETLAPGDYLLFEWQK